MNRLLSLPEFSVYSDPNGLNQIIKIVYMLGMKLVNINEVAFIVEFEFGSF